MPIQQFNIGETQVHTMNSGDPRDVKDGTDFHRAMNLNNLAQTETRKGNHLQAERLHTEALRLKKLSKGPDSITYALSAHALAETQIQLEKWDEAEANLLRAQKIREKAEKDGFKTFDAAVTRDILAQVYEYRGDFEKARAVRTKVPNNMACSYYECPLTNGVNLASLKQCGKCRATFYCSVACQKSDWKRHKKFCKSTSTEA